MDRPTLQTPRSGRSRFSKALPAPPPALEDDRPRTATRNLPSLPYSPFPPRKESVSVNTSVTASVLSSLETSPLPALPSENIMEAPPLQPQTRSIPRKPVGLPANPTPAAAAKSKKMKRVSSISSLLSAYSNTSSDSVQRSSQGSIFTKDSEPSNSPEREGMNDAQQSLTKTLPILPSNPYEDELFLTTDPRVAADLPPPPPLKDLTRPSTPQSGRAIDPDPASRTGAQDGGPAVSDSPTLASPQRREIWRRRASSKSDRSLLVPELKLAVSHGSTASTAQPTQPTNSATTVNPELLPPPPLAHNNNNNSSATNSPLPPRSGSLPGRNIRPNRQNEAQGEGEMRKLTSKLKGLAGRGGSPKEKDAESRKGESAESSPAPPLKDRPSAEETSTNASKTSVDTVVFAPTPTPAPVPAPAPASTSSAPTISWEPPSREPAEKSISRRPIGAPAPVQPEVQKGSSSDARKPPNPPSLGLPRFPRPSQSSTSLRSPSVPYTVQETVRPRVSPPVASPSVVSTPIINLPTNANEPVKKPELYNLVTALNEPRVSPDSAAAAAATRSKPARKVSKDIDATNLSDIGESTEQMTAEQVQQVNEALSRFPRNAIPPAASSSSSAGTVWQAAPLLPKHYTCYTRHFKWVPVKNLNYSLSCQTCGVQDSSTRKTCSFCSLRICFRCHERLMGPYKSDLKALMDNMEVDVHKEKQKEKGKQKDAA
ncbi:hypothetical protein F4820DRAFT_428456 [Hypoxylon rubiginosum]|uniref:Uncharacterized protein n=1 Tax=Hypoxylon rubiginosum TaxID=110542 RepID=A0ACB9YUE9_9PEZI|nr:hypothetical protein F4820DRAFT_428456 [Hypoxylon rubiginosum]